MDDKIAYQGVTFDDVLLEPAFSDVVPTQADVGTRLTRSISLNIPILSAPMDTVTESALAIAIAQVGGIGIIHKNLTVEQQCVEVEKVKRSANGIIENPVTLTPDDPLDRARQLMDEKHISGVPIVENGGLLAGILTRRDLRFQEDDSVPIRQVMTGGRDRLVCAPAGTKIEEAERILHQNRVEKLLLVDDDFHLRGMITIKDIDKLTSFPNACRDVRGRLRVGAAVSVHEYERIEALLKQEVDVLVVDTAHGHSNNVIETVKRIKKQYEIDVIAGNVATSEGTRALIDAGVDAVKVGIGPGSICTTRVISGVGVPQITAIHHSAQEADQAGIPIIGDGGIRYSGDVTKAIAAGASSVMIGGLFAGVAESPGKTISYRGRLFKQYRGMGSMGAMVQGSSSRYRQEGVDGDKLVPEGVEGRVPFKGPLDAYVYQLVGGIRAGMGYCGCHNIEALRKHARFIKISAASLNESHPHDIAITSEAPNYSTEYQQQHETV